MLFFEKLIWGSKPVHSRMEFKYAMLRGDFAIIIMMVGVFYSILDSFNGVFVFIPWYAFMLSICMIAIWCNRKRYYTASTAIILFIINFLIYLFADVDHPEGGVFFFFMTSAMAGIILMSYFQTSWGFVFALLPVILAYLAYFLDLKILPPPSYEPGMVAMNFIANFTISVSSTIFMLQFLINRNKESEEELMERNKQLEKTNKELDHFVYSVSHDLRAPLTSILGLANIYNLAKDEEEKKQMVEMIHERASSLDGFIREVLDYSRNSRVELRLQQVNLKEVIDEVIYSMMFIVEAEYVTVSINVSPALTIITDRERLKVILSNLISNAFFYRDHNKKSFLEINASVSNDLLSLSLKDNGIGIRPEHTERIFEMFYKAHDRAQGTGLGLYIVKETLQRLHGDISVSSDYGVGSEFIITIKTEK